MQSRLSDEDCAALNKASAIMEAAACAAGRNWTDTADLDPATLAAYRRAMRNAERLQEGEQPGPSDGSRPRQNLSCFV